MDNCCREYLFVVDFFGHIPNTAQSFFDEILGKTLAYLLVSQLDVFLITEVYLSSHSLLPLPLPPPSSSLLLLPPPPSSSSLLPFLLHSQQHIAQYVDSCYDAIGIFLCIHVNHRYQAIMKRRNIPCLGK